MEEIELLDSSESDVDDQLHVAGEDDSSSDSSDDDEIHPLARGGNSLKRPHDGLEAGGGDANSTNNEPNSKVSKMSDTGTGGYSSFAHKMMSKMGYQKGKGLGKHSQGRVEIVESSKQRGRRGLGLHLQGLESSEIDWDFEQEQLSIEEKIEWLPACTAPSVSLEELHSWKKIGPKKLTIDDEDRFCHEDILKGVLNGKNVFDTLEPEEMRRARTRSNPYETIRGVFFLNRAAMKMANMDAALNFMFTDPRLSDGASLVQPNELFYFADICAGPGGFSEYVLWRKEGEAKGFGMTLKGPCDFKLVDFFAGPSELFEPHYGVGGLEGDGDIFNPDNQAAFINFVRENTDGNGVHLVMADGGFSVEGQENLQEILSKQLYLCQFLVAQSILRPGGHFVCKLFDLFTPFSVGLIYLMYRAFDRVCIMKPVTSRPANSERYIICQGLRSDADTVRQYMHEVNLDLNRYMTATSKEDVREIVPMDVLENDMDFFEYICTSNNVLGKVQILNLKKIQAFTQKIRNNLYEARQAEIRKECLMKWKVEDKVRTAPPKKEPKLEFEDLTKNESQDYFDFQPEVLTPKTLSKVNRVYDFRCFVSGDQDRKRCYILGLGRTHVFKWDGLAKSKWKKLDMMQIELPLGTLIEAEFVQELKGEGPGQKRLTTIHAVDALFLYSKDVRYLHYKERLEKLRKFAKSVTKLTRPDLAPIIVPELFRLEQITDIFKRLELKRLKGGGSMPRLCYCPRDRPDARFFRPTGVYFIKTTKGTFDFTLRSV
ncbi:hypothetical protein ScPMuIL_013686 [Solemya velum]